MSKAEDLASQYRDFREQCGIKDPVMLNEIEEAYYEGYHQAEKDLELTWEDIETIQEMANKYCKYHSCEPRFFVYSEILKRFKERKEK